MAMEKFVSVARRDSLMKKERNLLILYASSALLLLGGILALIFTHTLANSALFLSFAITLGVLLALWSVFFWDFLFRRNHAYLRLQTLSLYAKTSELTGRVKAVATSLYQGYLPLARLTLAYSDEKGEHETTLFALGDFAWEVGKTYDFDHYDNLITGGEETAASSAKSL
jgi:hypothetical protein